MVVGVYGLVGRHVLPRVELVTKVVLENVPILYL